MNEEELLSTATEIGALLLENGAEIYRVEESVIRILQAYGVEEADVFAIPSCLITTVSVEGKNHTKLCRVYSRRTDLDRVERYNNLCRRICAQTPGRKEILRALGEIKGRCTACPCSPWRSPFPRRRSRCFSAGTGWTPCARPSSAR